MFIGEILNALAELTFPGSPSAYADFVQGQYAALNSQVDLDPDALMLEIVCQQAAMSAEVNKRKRQALAESMSKRAMVTAASFCVCAQRALDARQWHLAWTFLMDAQALRATLVTTVNIGLRGPKLASAVGRAGAESAHKENRDMRTAALAWLDEHRDEFSSLEEAADAISGKVVKMARSTVRNWITGYNLRTGERTGVSATGST